MQTEKSVVESENRYDKLCAENKSGYDGGGLESSARTNPVAKSETKSEKRDRDKQCASMQEQRQCANREIGW